MKDNEYDFTFFGHKIASGEMTEEEIASYLRKLADLVETSTMPWFRMTVSVDNVQG